MRNLRLRTQVRLVALGCLLLGISGTFLVAAHYEERLYDSALERRARVMVDSLLASAIEPLLNYDIVQLDNLVEAIRRDKSEIDDGDLEYAMILDAEGRVLAHSHGYYLYGTQLTDPASRAALDSATEALVQRLDHNRVLDVSRPVIVGGKRWGTVRVGLNLGLFKSQVNAAWVRTLMIVVALALGLALIASAFLRPLFVRPLAEVIAAATEIGRRNLGYRIAHQRKDEVGALYDAMNRMAVMLEEREKIHATFGRYVSTAVRDAILQGEVPTAGTRIRAAFLFADLRGFTRRSEGMAPEEVLALMNRFASRMTAAVETHGGMVDKFIGDAVMAVFGPPLSREHCAVRAVRCAMSMRQELRELNEELAQAGIAPLKMGIGIHVGEAVAGSMGAPTRMQYTVLGDAVNLAARLEELSKSLDTEVLASEEVVRECGDEATARDLGEVEIRGRQMRVRVFAVDGTQALVRSTGT